MFSNREIAAAVWLLILVLWALSASSLRRAIPGVLKAFFVKGIIIAIATMLFYALLLVLTFRALGFWDASVLKETILWAVGTVFATLWNLTKATEDRSYFRDAVWDNIRWGVVLEFIVNLYSFDLITELMLLPVLTCIVIWNQFAGSKPENKSVKTLLDYVLGLFGVAIIVISLREMSVSIQDFATLDKTLRDFFLPPALTIGFLPCVYLLALYSQYEKLFNRVDFANKNKDLARYTKRKFFAACHLNLSKLTRLSRNAGLLTFNSKDDVLDLIKNAFGSVEA